MDWVSNFRLEIPHNYCSESIDNGIICFRIKWTLNIPFQVVQRERNKPRCSTWNEIEKKTRGMRVNIVTTWTWKNVIKVVPYIRSSTFFPFSNSKSGTSSLFWTQQITLITNRIYKIKLTSKTMIFPIALPRTTIFTSSLRSTAAMTTNYILYEMCNASHNILMDAFLHGIFELLINDKDDYIKRNFHYT